MARLLPAIFSLYLASTALAMADPLNASYADGSVRLRGSYGLMSVGADEIVHYNNYQVSHLFWRSSNVQVLSGALEVDVTPEWTGILKGSFGMGGTHQIEDMDWLAPYAIDTTQDGWSDRSVHPNTTLDEYFEAEAALRYNVIDDSINTLGFLAGGKYTQVQWTAYGGTYSYSNNGFRDTNGSFADIPVGAYKQTMPVAYLGATGGYKAGAWSFNGTGTAGLAINPGSVDHHYLRTTLFEDKFQVAPAVSASLSAEYQLLNQISIYGDAKADWLFQTSGDTTATNWKTGAISSYPTTAAMGYYAGTVSLGLKGRF